MEVEVGQIRPCGEDDLAEMLEIINSAAEAYRGVIPPDRWHEPYMPMSELCAEIADGVIFYGYACQGRLLGIMGLQDRGDVFLIRHAYVRPEAQRQGIGGRLLAHLRNLVRLQASADRQILIGTWAAATWAIRFYEKHGFRQVSPEEKNRLLRTYWRIPARQVETSVVLADRA
ncbi:MAG: GNAT family N-acetyltransferase [Chloroflexi bacterium]|nr:GNAT family N-acetyltransferase [Chloroflexota bacterium]